MNLNNFIGQESIKKIFHIILKSYKNNILPSIFFHGPSGSGKTTLAQIYAKETGWNIYKTNGSNLQKVSDIVNIFNDLEEKTIIFIDEIHSMSSIASNFLLSIIDDRSIKIKIGKDYNMKEISIELPFFTIIAATTLLYKISNPLISRFNYLLHIETYSSKDIKNIVKSFFKDYNLFINDENLNLIVNHSKLNPRNVKNISLAIKNTIMAKNKKIINKKDILETFKLLDINYLGLNKLDLIYINCLKDNKIPLGISLISQITNIPKNTILNIIEPYLFRMKIIAKTPKGRKLIAKTLNIIK